MAPSNACFPPCLVQDADEIMWDMVCDVAVVGVGGAGICAAIEAKEHGADVLAIDRFDGGGATRYSGGVVYAGGGTRIQAEAGVDDNPVEMAKYLALEIGDAASQEVIEDYARGSSDQLDWLIAHGVPFDSNFYKEKIVYPPEGYFLQYSGNEKSPGYAEVAKPAARGHRTVGQGFTGVVFYDNLRRKAEEIGVRFTTHAPVRQLVVDRTGRVVGVKARMIDEADQKRHRELYDRVDPMKPFNAQPAAKASQASRLLEDRRSKEILIRARRGVILTTGGFSHNLDMLRDHVPLIAQNVGATMRMASLGCDGSGHQLGESVGGQSRGLSNIYLGRVMTPPSAYIRGVMVNAQGERFASEDAYNSILGGAILRQPNGIARLILNGRDFRSAVKECLTSGWETFRYFGGAALLNVIFGGTKRASSIAALARKCGMDPATLAKTITDYNADIDGEDRFGKLRENRESIDDDVYYAINFSISNTFAFTQLFTIGGLSVDEASGQVLNASARPIQGLYAAGRTAYGICSNNYVSGLSIGDCVYSGRRAGRHSAKS